MGKISKGILGGFSGKVGTVIGYNWRGQDMMRALPKKSRTAPTELQVRQRTKFAIAIAFLSPIRHFLEQYYLRSQGLRSRYNRAMGYTLKNAVVPDGADSFVLDYSKVLISNGQLRALDGATVTAKAGTKLEFAWNDNSGQGNANASDQLICIAFCEEMDAFHLLEGIAERGDGSVEIALPPDFSGLKMHVWASFTSATGKSSAISSYLGEVTNT